MGGEWLALGAAAALAAVSASRRGSRADLSVRYKTYPVSARDLAVYEDGFKRGKEVALGTDWRHDDWEETGDFDNVDDAYYDLAEWAHEAEDYGRQLAAFSHTASALHMRPDADSVWDDYNDGIADGVLAGVRERLKMEPEPPEKEVKIPEVGTLMLPPHNADPSHLVRVVDIKSDGSVVFAPEGRRGLTKIATRGELASAGWYVAEVRR